MTQSYQHHQDCLFSGDNTARASAVTPWAVWGVICTAMALYAWIRWVSSGELFAPAPIQPGNEIEAWRLAALRVLEALSMTVVAFTVWKGFLRPWLRERTYGLEAMMLLAGVVGFWSDALLNAHELLFAFNAHSINMGVWTAFMPFYTDGPTRYGESLLWGFPMYIYFGISAAYVGCDLIARLRKKSARLSNAAIISLVYVFFVVCDFILENLIIRITHAYMYPKTYGPLTAFEGSMYQFPVYESLLSALVCLGYTLIRQSALDSSDGLSFVEKGVSNVSTRYQLFLRTMAVIGAGASLNFVVYHLPFNWLGLIGESIVRMPSYMYPG